MKKLKRRIKMNKKEVEKKLGLKFKNGDLLKNALIHRSYLNESKDEDLENNERLEFLGDAVLELIISTELYIKYPEKTEGKLTSIRSALVRTESLAEESRRLDIGKHILMSKGEGDSGGADKDFILANTYEALLGAIYLDRGLKECEKFVKRTVLKKLPRVIREELFIDPKTKIQELVQAKYKVTPTYKVIKEQGPDHDKSFTVVLKVGNKIMAKGSGLSKQKAEEDAAQKSIDLLQNS
jgi:ribonuclease-3